MVLEVRVVDQMDEPLLAGLSRLLCEVVNGGAALGFLAPLGQGAAADYFRSVPRPGVVLVVAEQDGVVVGTAQLHDAAPMNAAHRAEVAKVMVHPAAQRRGIARALMERIEREARARARTLLVLDTRSGDVSSDLYRSLGYVEVGTIPRYARSSNGQLHATVVFYKELV
jgi:ribosomal protein S18 acetylase RimI-like enzyme